MPLIPLFIGGDSGVTVSATVAVMTLTEYSAAITIDREVFAGTDALALSTHAATISIGGNVNVSANTDALILTTYSATIEGSFVTTTEAAGGGVPSKKRQRRRIIENAEPIIPETQELPEEPKRKPRKIEVKKYEMLDIPKVISEGWKPKEKYNVPVEARQIEALLPKPEVKKKPEIDFTALERELTEAIKRKRIQEQNDLIMLLAMEEA